MIEKQSLPRQKRRVSVSTLIPMFPCMKFNPTIKAVILNIVWNIYIYTFNVDPPVYPLLCILPSNYNNYRTLSNYFNYSLKYLTKS